MSIARIKLRPSKRTKTELNQIKKVKAIIEPGDREEYKVIYHTDLCYQGYSFTTYGLGLNYTDIPEKRKIYRKILVKSFRATIDLFIDYYVTNLNPKPICLCNFDILVIQDIDYIINKADKTEDILIRALFLKEGKEVLPNFKFPSTENKSQ